MPTPYKVTPEVLADIPHRWNAGESQGEIGKALNLDRGTVARHLRKLLGVETPAHWAGGGRVALPQFNKAKPPPRPIVYPDNPQKLLILFEISPGEAARYWSKVASPNEHGCRLWLASLDQAGYGQFGVSYGCGIDKAYRVSWRLTYGPIPEGMQINHRCDVRACVEPTHLWLGTQAENLADMAAKGRSRKGRSDGQKGEDNIKAKLTWEVVREIRRLREQEGLPLYAIADRFGISASQACNITKYRQWVE